MDRPETTWTAFLSHAPSFTGALMAAVRDSELASYNDRVRALVYYDLFDGEVSNGGVMQYLFNQAFNLPEFEAAPSIIAKDPVLADGAEFVAEVYDRWPKIRSRVSEFCAADDWPEELFSDNQFEGLEERFFAVNHSIRLKLYAAICRSPHDYVQIRPEPQDAQYRFVDGFPVGPNVIDSHDGEMVVWFSADRLHVDVERPALLPESGPYSREWVDFRTGASGCRHFTDHRLTSHETRKALWYEHGVREVYREDGAVSSTRLSLDGEAVIECFSDRPPLVNGPRLKSLLHHGEDVEF
ncbi:MAG: DUF4375 domain-containing protein [Myxococcota bacterium]